MKDFSNYRFYSEYPNYQVAQKEREEYVEGIETYLEILRNKSVNERKKYLNPDSYFSDPERYRREYRDMLGVPLSGYSDGMPVPKVRKTYVATDEMCEIYRMQIEIADGFWFYGIYFVPNDKKNKKTGLVICQHGGGGTPELCADMVGKNNYHNMVHRILDCGIRVFAPQILVWGKIPGGNDAAAALPSLAGKREFLDRSLKQLGSSIAAVEIYSIMRSLDYFCADSLVDEAKIGMIGLSYGGFYTLITAAADQRIVSAYSSCAMNDRFKYNLESWIWNNSGNTFNDEGIAAIIAPRRFYCEIGRYDTVFTCDTAPDFNALVKPFYAKFGAEGNFRFNIHDDPEGHRIDTADCGFDFFTEPLL